MECCDFFHMNTGVFFIFAVMSYSQLHFISTLEITGYPVRLSFNRHNIAHFENSTETFCPCFSVDNKNIRVVHANSPLIPMRLDYNNIGEALKCIKLHLEPHVSVSSWDSVRYCRQITIDSISCFFGIALPKQSATLKHRRGFDLRHTWDYKKVIK